MKDASWTKLAVAGDESEEIAAANSEAPPYAPFYWGLKDYPGKHVGSAAVVERMRQLLDESMPNFVAEQNRPVLADHAEFWFGANGAGARAHMDSHCVPTIGFVLRGARRWRVGPPPRLRRGDGRSRAGDFVFDDGVAYGLGWRPCFEMVLQANEAIFFPPGWLHETLNTAEGCTASLTLQLPFPLPAAYYRSYYNRLRRIGDLSNCWDSMVRLGSLGDRVPADEKAAEFAARLWASRGGRLSPEELAFHDLDGDGATTFEEFSSSYVAWAATENAVLREHEVDTPRVSFNFSHSEPVPARWSEEL